MDEYFYVIENTTEFNTSQIDMDKVLMGNIEYYIDGVLSIIVICLGLIGNFLTVIVLTRPTMHSSTNVFLTGLAIWDMMVLFGTLFLITLPKLSAAYMAVVFPYIVAYGYPIALIAQTSTVWITVTFTVERYIAVCHPLRATTMCTITRARAAIISVSICATLFNLCRWFEFEVIDVVKETVMETNVTINGTFTNQTTNDTIIQISTEVENTAFGNSEQFKTVFYRYMYPFVMLIVPLSVLAILNTFLVHAVKRSRQQQITMNVRQSRENNVTIMLVSVVIVFMICQVPALVYNIAYSINEHIESKFSWKVLSSLRNFLVNFNSAINFILYCAFGQKFRCIFIRTFCRRLLRDSDFNSMSCASTTRIVTKLDNKKYKTMLLKQGGNCMEMSATQQTRLSQYSPYASRSPSPQPHTRRYTNGLGTELRPGSDYSCKSHLISGGSRTPSPTEHSHS